MLILCLVNDLGAAQLTYHLPDVPSAHSSDIDLSFLDKTLSSAASVSPLPPPLSPSPNSRQFTFCSLLRASTPVPAAGRRARRPAPSAAAGRPPSTSSSDEDIKP